MSKTRGLVPRTYCIQCDVPQKLTPEQTRRKQLMSRYRLTPEQFDAMGKAQNWQCYLCEVDISDAPYIDHNHVTKKVRKLLCLHCNLGLGHFFDSTTVLTKAIEYISQDFSGVET